MHNQKARTAAFPEEGLATGAPEQLASFGMSDDRGEQHVSRSRSIRRSAFPVRLVTAAVMISVAALSLAGCAAAGHTSKPAGLFGISVTGTPTPSATPKPISEQSLPLGATISKAVAHKLRDVSDPPANGDYAYQMPDGTWVKTNLNQPLPPAVQQAEQAKIDSTVTLPSDLSPASYGDASRAAQAAAASATYSTGKSVIVITQELHANRGTMIGNHLAWTAFGSVNAAIMNADRQGGWSSGSEGVSAVEGLLAGDPDAAQYVVFAVNR